MNMEIVEILAQRGQCSFDEIQRWQGKHPAIVMDEINDLIREDMVRRIPGTDSYVLTGRCDPYSRARREEELLTYLSML